MGLNRSRWITLACAISLFALNAWMCGRLFHTEFTVQIGSIESAFISFSRWMMDHWHDRRWMPLWVEGVPARQVYGPVLHTAVARLAMQMGWTPQHAYHFLTALTYCLGPVTLFWLVYRGTLNRAAGLLAGLLYSLVSPSAFVFGTIRDDLQGHWGARRFDALVRYGEGPHVTDLMMIPLVLWMVDQAVSARRWLFVFLSPIALAVLVLTNWTGTTGFAIVLFCYILSKWNSAKYGEERIHWPTLIGIGVIAYMLAAPWAPPSLVRTMQVASASLTIQPPFAEKLRVLIPLALTLLAMHVLFQRFRVERWTRCFAYFALITGVVTFCEFRHIPVIPIGHRFQLEMEIALTALGGILGAKLLERVPRNPRYAIIALLLVGCVWQARYYRRDIRSRSTPLDFSQTEEYKMAHWIAANLQGQRMFAPGSLSDWMNLYSDVWQFYGCCDQSVLADEIRFTGYLTYASGGAGERDAELTTLWLKLYGISAVAVQSNTTWQTGQPFLKPHKFDGHLDELWRDGESVIYRVPWTGSFAHVVPQRALPPRHPINALDVEPLLPLVAAIDKPSNNATLKWISQHEAEIIADMGPDDVIYLPQTYDAGWHAYLGSDELTITRNVLGMTTIRPAAAGHHTIRMIYSGSLEDRLAYAAHWIGALLLIIWTYRRALV